MKNLPRGPQQKLDSLFRQLNKADLFNGNVLVAENNQVIYKSSFGYSDFSKRKANDEHTLFCLSSVSKVITSTAILQLVEKRKIALDEKLKTYLPEFPYPEITIRHLLSHTSGLPDYQLFEKQIGEHPQKIFDNSDLMPALKLWQAPLSNQPGEAWNYSNTNYMLLALLIEKITKTTFQSHIRKNIFEPAGMNNTFFASEPDQKDERAINHEYPFLFSMNRQNVDSLRKYRWRTYNASGFVGQGNLISETSDLLKFDSALYEGKLLSRKSINEAFTPTRKSDGSIVSTSGSLGNASYGLGWFILSDTTNGRVVWHTGGQPGALSIFLRNIDKQQTVVIFDNAFNRNIYRNGLEALHIMNGKEVAFAKISSVKEYARAIQQKGIDAAYVRLKQLQDDNYYINEDDMNELGLQILYAAGFEGHTAMALEILKLNTLFFPDSFNTYDSYGEALAHCGKKQEAIYMYQKSIQLNPDNAGAKRALKELLK
jgi:CubicO group peptidase (beta-lactamase class C family)